MPRSFISAWTSCLIRAANFDASSLIFVAHSIHRSRRLVFHAWLVDNRAMLIARLTLGCVLLAVAALAATAQTREQIPNYDYLLGRNAERAGDVAVATASYQTIVSNNSRLKEYALWRLSKIARASGDLVLERERLQQLLATAPSSLLNEAATLRMIERFIESGDFNAAANSAKPLPQSKK